MRFFQKIKNGLNKITHNPTFTLKEQLGYASGCFGNELGQDMIATFITLFFTDFYGIDSKAILILMAVAKVVNIIGDPVAGFLMDRPGGRHGRARPFLLFAPLPLAISSIMMFVVPSASMAVRIAWVSVFYLVYCLADTFYDMSLLTVSARMTNNPSDRKNFYTFGEFAGTLGSLLPGGVIPILIHMYSTNFNAQGKIYLIAAIIFGIMGFVAMIIPYYSLSEKVQVSTKQPPVKINFKAILLNKPLLLVSLSLCIDSIRQVCYGALAYFYLKTLNAFWLSTVIGAISSTLSYVGLLLVPIIGKKLSSRNMLVGGYFFTGALYLLLFITGYKSLFLVAALLALSGFPNGAMRAARKILLADSTDYMEWKAWKKYGYQVRSEGMVFAVYSMSRRISTLWRDLLLPAGLSLIGYASAQVINNQTVEAVQTPETLHGIFLLVTVPGIIGNIVPGLIMMLDNYTGKRKQQILDELYEMREATGTPVPILATIASDSCGIPTDENPNSDNN